MGWRLLNAILAILLLAIGGTLIMFATSNFFAPGMIIQIMVGLGTIIGGAMMLKGTSAMIDALGWGD